MADDVSRDIPPSDRARVRRNAARASYDRAAVYAVLDANVLCHVAYVVDGEPRLIPTLYIRRGDHVYLHGNRQSAVLRAVDAGQELCIGVTSMHGVVVARSGFHCSMNYASVTLFGRGEGVDPTEQPGLLDAFVGALIPGHETVVRAPTAEELAATRVVRVPIAEAAVKQRRGDPIDADADMNAGVWAGQIPIRATYGPPVAAADLKPGVELPDYIAGYPER